jgi:MFS family permease
MTFKKKEWHILLTVCFSMFLIPMNITSSSVMMLSLMNSYHITYQESQWFINVLMIFYGAFLPITGRLSDLYGRKKIFLIGLCLFLLGFLLGSIIDGYYYVVISRGLCGIASAAVTTSATSLLASNIDDKNRKVAFSIFGSFLGTSMIVGPFLSSLLNEYSNGWFLFSLFNIIILFHLVLSSIYICDLSKIEKRTFDFFGSILLTIIIFSLVTVASFFPVWGLDIKTQSILMLSAICFPLLLFFERKADNPIINLNLMSNKDFSSMGFISLLLGWGYISVMMYIPYVLNVVTHFSRVEIGTIATISTLPSLLFPPLISKFRQRVGDKVLISMTLMCLVISPMSLFLVIPSGSFVQFCFSMLFLGCSFGLSLSYLDGVAVSSVEPENSGLAAGTFNTFRIGGESIFIPLVSSLTAMFVHKKIGIDIFFTREINTFHSNVSQMISSFSLVLVIIALVCFFSSIVIMKRYRSDKSWGKSDEIIE